MATAQLIGKTLAPKIAGQDALATGAAWHTMVHAIRNLGRPGICSMAIAAADNALWDLKGKCLERFGGSSAGSRPSGDHGIRKRRLYFLYDKELVDQLAGWAGEGLRAVKMKIGRDPAADVARVKLVREAIGPHVALFVDANGAYTRKQALAAGEALCRERSHLV